MKNKKYIVMLVVFALFIVILAVFIFPAQDKKEFEKYKHESYSKIILDKYYKGRLMPAFRFTDGSEYIGVYGFADLYKISDIGDTIKKLADTTLYLVHKRDTTISVYYYMH